MTAFERLADALDANLLAPGARDLQRASWSINGQIVELVAAGDNRADIRFLHGVERPTVINFDNRLDDLDAFVGGVRTFIVDLRKAA